MEQYLASFLEALQLNRNVSPHTLRNYRGDVLLFFEFARERTKSVAVSYTHLTLPTILLV